MGATPCTRSDRELLAAWRGGEREAGNELFARHFRAVFRFFSSKLGAVAEDLTQKTFMGLLESAGVEVQSFRGYLFGLAKNQLYMHLRQRERDARFFDPDSWSLHDLGLAPLRAAAADEDQRAIEAALQTLPLDHRVTLELFYWEGLGVAEVAEALGVAVGTVKARLARARSNLRATLERANVSPAVRDRVSGDLERWLRAGPAAHKRGDDGDE